MTLVENDPVLKYLWLKVQQLSSYENVAQSFWHHLYTHYWFNERKYIVDYEHPPSPAEENKRKVDQVVSEFDYSTSAGYVMLFHEIKRMEATDGDLAEVENQALSACESYCVDHGIKRVYAQTSIGTRARFWVYTSNKWRPLDNYDPGTFAAYSEMNDDAGESHILYMINDIKAARPDYPTSSAVQTSSSASYGQANQIPVAAPASTNTSSTSGSSWIWSQQYQRYYRQGPNGPEWAK